MTFLMDILPHSPPLEIFESWMGEAKAQAHIKEPTAMSVATVNAAHEVHARVVLCKAWSSEGFVFFSNYESQKGQDLADDKHAAAVFYWDPMFRQIKITATVEKTSRQVSETYWNSRARESQLSQFISRQSRPVASREVLEAARAQADVEFRDQPIPCPATWGGYLLRPKAIEFWLGLPNRLHDRHVYEKTANSWTYRRLYP